MSTIFPLLNPLEPSSEALSFFNSVQVLFSSDSWADSDLTSSSSFPRFVFILIPSQWVRGGTCGERDRRYTCRIKRRRVMQSCPLTTQKVLNPVCIICSLLNNPMNEVWSFGFAYAGTEMWSRTEWLQTQHTFSIRHCYFPKYSPHGLSILDIFHTCH